MKVIIDASHGGSDIGYSANNINEKDLSLLISKYLYDTLKKKGIDAYLVRDSDITLSDNDRVNKILSNAKSGDIIISNHLNEGKGDGAEIIYPLRSNNTLASTVATNIESVGQNVNKYYQRRLPSDLSKDYDYLLRNTNPYNGLIIEYGYVDSTGDDVNLLKNNYKSLASAVANALVNYIGSKDIYTIKKGDTLYSIAKKYNTTIDKIKELNNLSSNTLKVGNTLKVPISIEEDKVEDTSNTYTVKKGDTLYSIARNNNTTVNTLKSLNNLTSNVLSIGMKLKLPVNYTIYTIVKGDNLYSIARRYNTSVSAIKQLNNITSNILTIGNKLKIPT